MSTSPEKDLHSVYIDGEMPENFVSRYEDEISRDEKAKAELEKMRSLHNLFQEDAKSKSVDKIFADQSFERLKTKMSYSKTLKFAEKKPSFITPIAKYTASFAAAAAVFAFVFIPVYNRDISLAKTSELAAIEIKNSNEITPISEKQVVVDGNFKTQNLSSKLALTSQSKAVATAKIEASGSENETADKKSILDSLDSLNSKEQIQNLQSQQIEQKTVRASALVSGGNSVRSFNLPSVDPFMPNFSSSQIRISVPKFGEIGNNLEER